MELDNRPYQAPQAFLGRLEAGASTCRSSRLRVGQFAGQMQRRAEYPRSWVERALPTDVIRDRKQVLLVDPSAAMLSAIQDALLPVADIETCSTFSAARARFQTRPPDLLITNLRLEAYNGLHLVLVTAKEPTRCIVYTTHHDPILALEAQAAGAFYECSKQLTSVLPAYVRATLPRCDRRVPTVVDPPLPHRGGRRCSDL